MRVKLRRGIQKYQSSGRLQEPPQSGKDLRSIVPAGDIIKSEDRQDEVELSHAQMAVLPVRDNLVFACKIELPSDPEHVLRDVDTDRLESQPLEESRRSSRPTAEIDSSCARHMCGNDRREVAVGQVIRVGELELGVRLGPRSVSPRVLKIF